MDNKTILAVKVAYLSGNSPNDIDETMKKQIQQDKQLAQEIAFVESFWSSEDEAAQEMPSKALDARFYQMLSVAQAAQSKGQAEISHVKKTTWLDKLGQWLLPKPIMQLAMMAGVFSLGYYINAPVSDPEELAMNSLKQEVQSLSSLVALSMIDNSSASKRLTGISYSKQSGANDQILNNALLKMINADKSTAVRLAAIDALSSRGFDANMELALLEGLAEQNLMVQIELVSLLISQGSQISQIKLKDLAANGALDNEAKEFFELHLSAQKAENSI